MTLKGTRVLVTGATGFIGSRLIEKLTLEHNAQVRALVHNLSHCSQIARFPVEISRGDYNDAADVQRAVEGCDLVFHLAVSYPDTLAGMRKTTVAGTESVARACQANGVKRLIYFSTFSVYGDTETGDLYEHSPYRKTRDPYALGKREAEAAVLRLHRETGLGVVVLQPTIVYGPHGYWTTWPIQQMTTHRVVLPDEGLGYCNAVYVDDVVNGAILAAEADNRVSGETLLISGTESTTWRDFYSSYQRGLGLIPLEYLSANQMARAMRAELRNNSTMLKMRQAMCKYPELRAIARHSWPGEVGYRFMKHVLPPNNLKAFQSRILSTSSTNERPLALPLPVHLPMYLSKTHVCIEKAQDLIGYQPQIDLAVGMKMTVAWAKWANLLPQ